MNKSALHLMLALAAAAACPAAVTPTVKPPKAIVMIYADDLGYGDVGCYGAKGIPTPSIDKLAEQGCRFTDAYSTTSVCTPSRYALFTGEYPWRKEGTGILPGDAALIIDTKKPTLPKMLQSHGYKTYMIGKWHLGLGEKGKKIDWNKHISPSPNEIGFDESFIFAATGDRVPCVILENGNVRNLDPNDPIEVSYKHNFPGLPNGKDNKDQLKLMWSHGHNQAIINGIGRIGFMKGGKSALWKDEENADVITDKAIEYIQKSAKAKEPFFLMFATHDIHVPRCPEKRFVGKSRAGKYSILEGGSRIPFIVKWPGVIKPGTTSKALLNQMDLGASLEQLLAPGKANSFRDSENVMPALLGKSAKGRDYHVINSTGKALAIRHGKWKFIPAGVAIRDGINGASAKMSKSPEGGSLFDLEKDPKELDNVASQHPDICEQMKAKLEEIRQRPETKADQEDLLPLDD